MMVKSAYKKPTKTETQMHGNCSLKSRVKSLKEEMSSAT